jgi:hypothetical protein
VVGSLGIAAALPPNAPPLARVRALLLAGRHEIEARMDEAGMAADDVAARQDA